jgi:hypothetical protein
MKPILVFQTDFTYKEGAVCAMYGVVKSVDRDLEIIGGTHEIPQYDVWSASYRLYQSMQFWPAGTIFVSVVDPGVGTERRGCVAQVEGGYFVVTPDNGTLTHVKAWIGIQAMRQIDESVNRLRGRNTEGTSVFHGRDVFSYCAARLASGVISYEGVGPAYPLDEIVTLPMQQPAAEPGKVRGIFEIGDPNFGNLWTNIPFDVYQSAGFNYGDHIHTIISHQDKQVFNETLLFERSFGFVAKGEVMIYTNELMRISLAVNQGSLTERFNLGHGQEWVVEFTRQND